MDSHRIIKFLVIQAQMETQYLSRALCLCFLLIFSFKLSVHAYRDETDTIQYTTMISRLPVELPLPMVQGSFNAHT
jgi:hypothetical protein